MRPHVLILCTKLLSRTRSISASAAALRLLYLSRTQFQVFEFVRVRGHGQLNSQQIAICSLSGQDAGCRRWRRSQPMQAPIDRQTALSDYFLDEVRARRYSVG